MVDAGREVILFSEATFSVRGRGGAFGFSSEKFGVRGLTESIARNYDQNGIWLLRIN